MKDNGMTRATEKLLLKVADKIAEKPKEFDMHYWVDASSKYDKKKHVDTVCGTTACIAGHVVLLSRRKLDAETRANISKLLKTKDADEFHELANSIDWDYKAELLLGISGSNLFDYGSWPRAFRERYENAQLRGNSRGKARAAIARIKHLIETGE